MLIPSIDLHIKHVLFPEKHPEAMLLIRWRKKAYQMVYPCLSGQFSLFMIYVGSAGPNDSDQIKQFLLNLIF